MKNIEQILKDAGVEVSESQAKAISDAVAENYKTVADYNKQVKKNEAAETERDNWKSQYEDAQETLKGFDGVDVEKMNKDIADWKNRAEKAEKDAQAQILQRDQRDYLKTEFDKLGISSDRTRKSLMADIMGEDGLKWKDGSFMGLSDYLAKENEKDHFYQTEEEKTAAAAKEKAAGGAPKFTDKSEPHGGEPAEKKIIPKIW